MTEDPKTHWQRVYQTKAPTQVSWYQPIPVRSLEFIQATGVPPSAPILDVGGGASTLVDHLQHAGFTDLTVLDLAPEALDEAQARLGRRASEVHWIAGDITVWQPRRRYGIWHDRAALHFLVDPDHRRRYLEVLKAACAPDGHVLLATFSPAGPVKCSGLPVQRYNLEALSAFLGTGFQLVRGTVDHHVTPTGHSQQFVYGWWRAA